MKKQLHIGTSGWSYKHWKGIFYPDDIKTTDWLPFYAKTFSVTEINTSFYHLPAKKTVRGWVKKVPPGFLFCPKMSRYLTHMKKLHEPEDSLKRFFDVFTPMYDHMGPLLMQLPRMVRYEKEKAEYLFKILYEQYSSFMFSLEVRHDSWLSEESINLMKQYNIGFVISQSGTGFPYKELLTAKHIYIRFHGPEQLYASSYDDKTLRYFARLARKWIKEKHSVWCFFNNDIHGHAINNAKTLEGFLER